MIRLFSTLVVGTGLALATAATGQTFSFESPNANYYTYNPSGFAGATFNDHSGVSIMGSPFFSTTPPDGNQAAFIQSVSGDIGAISLALTGLVSGTSYSASFYLAQRYGYANNVISVAFNGTALGSFAAPGLDFTAFTAAAFVANGASGTLTFTGAPTTTGDNDANLDLVSVRRLGAAAAVPEPATWATMITGLGMAGMAMRRRRRALVRFA